MRRTFTSRMEVITVEQITRRNIELVLCLNTAALDCREMSSYDHFKLLSSPDLRSRRAGALSVTPSIAESDEAD